MGVIFTSKRRLDQCYRTILAHPEGISGAIDGTFGFHSKRWVFLNTGATSTHLDTKRNVYTQSYNLFLLCLTKSETIHSSSKVLGTLKEAMRTFFDVELRYKYMSMDHSPALKGGLMLVYPDTQILTCWPHLLRAVNHHSRELKDKEENLKLIKKDFLLLQLAGSKKMFDLMAEIATNY